MEHQDGMPNVIRVLQMAQRVSQFWHWKVKSFAMHMALGELYEKLRAFADELAEMYIGAHGDFELPLSDPNAFSEQDPLEFITQLYTVLAQLETTFPQEGFLVNKYQELQGEVARVKYKLENLK